MQSYTPLVLARLFVGRAIKLVRVKAVRLPSILARRHPFHLNWLLLVRNDVEKKSARRYTSLLTIALNRDFSR